MVMVGFNPVTFVGFLRGIPFYIRDRHRLLKLKKVSRDTIPMGRSFPILHERFCESGSARGHYFHQDLLVARKIHENNPRLHVDIGSRIDGFVAHVASFRSIEVMDIRPLQSKLAPIKFIQADLMNPLGNEWISYCDSLSCLHALEHFGLGRYGDPINFEGHLIGFENMSVLLKSGGRFYFSVPIGPLRIEFNAHRVFSVDYLLNMFSENHEVVSFSFVDDAGDLHEDVSLEVDSDRKNNFGCTYGCGIFTLVKR